MVFRSESATAGVPLPPRQRLSKAGTTGFMLAMHIGTVAALLPRFWSWQGLVLLLVLYWATVLGVTLGLHRLLAHRSFDAARGLWWARREWMLRESPALQHVEQLTGDLQGDPLYRWLDRWFLLLQLPLGALLYWSGELAGVHGGGLGLVLWAIPLRLVLVHHVIWLVNSATHAFGYRNFDCPDLSRNCWWVALLSFGEGWHNHHHAFPHSARHGLRWFEFDITWHHIRLLRALGMARRVRLARY